MASTAGSEPAKTTSGSEPAKATQEHVSSIKNTFDDSANPFYLHPSDNPGSILVSQPMNGNNYNSWCRAMKMALISKNKFGFVDGSIAEPTEKDCSLSVAWTRNNNIVASWLLNSISKEIIASVIYASSAAEIWTDLRERFQQRNGPSIF